jgi:uncharacterized protein YycO
MLEPSDDFVFHDGDLVFQDLAGDGLAQAIETVTPGYMNSEVSHVGIIIKIRGRDYVIEAFPPEVRLTSFMVFRRRALDEHNRPRVFVGRLKMESQHLIPAALEKALQLRGLPYDSVYLSGEDAYYCSELVVDAFKYANRGEAFFPESPMSFRDPATGEIPVYWRRYYDYFGIDVPEGVVGSNPGSLSLSEKIHIAHRFGFLTNWH